MRLPVFLGLTTLGSAIWNTVFVLAGYFLGANWHTVSDIVSTYSKVVLAVVALAAVAFVAVRLRRRPKGTRPEGARGTGRRATARPHPHDDQDTRVLRRPALPPETPAESAPRRGRHAR
jgi:membrane protein implicated in regulation of membrane protease activity